MIEFSFLLLSTAALFCFFFGLLRYRTPFNPISIYAVLQVGGYTLLSGAVAYQNITFAPYPPSAIAQTNFVALTNLIGVVFPFLWGRFWPANVYRRTLHVLGLSSPKIATRFSLLKFVVLLGMALLSFVALTIVGGGGTLWITDTRAAYISYRAGAGPFFAATQWFLVFALLYYLWAKRPRRISHLALILLPFSVLAYFTGSKGNVMIIFLIGIVHYHFRVHRIRLGTLIFLATVLLVTFLGLLIQQGFEEDLLGAMDYFRDYSATTAHFLSRIDDWGYRFGEVTLSGFWYYVPRALYSSKPYEYGVTLIHEQLFPGAAATGNTPGILLWSGTYWDFGVIGVFLLGLWTGIFQRATYEHFLRHSESFIAFLFMLQFTIYYVLPFATAEMVLLLSIALSAFFKLVIRPRHRKLEFRSALRDEVS